MLISTGKIPKIYQLMLMVTTTCKQKVQKQVLYIFSIEKNFHSVFPTPTHAQGERERECVCVCFAQRLPLPN